MLSNAVRTQSATTWNDIWAWAGGLYIVPRGQTGRRLSTFLYAYSMSLTLCTYANYFQILLCEGMRYEGMRYGACPYSFVLTMRSRMGLLVTFPPPQEELVLERNGARSFSLGRRPYSAPTHKVPHFKAR